MIQNEKLTEVYVHKIEDDCFYLELVYLYEDEAGLHKVTFPHVTLATSLYRIPRYSIDKIKINEAKDKGHQNHRYYFGSSDEGMRILPGIVDTKIGPMNHAYYVDEIIRHNVHEMTLEEIEDALGYPVKIINQKEVLDK